MQQWQSQTLADNLKRAAQPFIVPLHPAGYKWVMFSALTWLVAMLAGWSLAGPLLLLTVFAYFSFRNPPRVTAAKAGDISAPCDGIISQHILMAVPPLFAKTNATVGSWQQMKIINHITDVHILCAPAAGTVSHITHRSGSWGSPVFDNDAPDNEQLIIAFDLAASGQAILVITAGLLPERIQLSVKADALVTAGQPIGMAAFGAEVTVYVPTNMILAVKPGQRLVAGETVIAAAVAA